MSDINVPLVRTKFTTTEFIHAIVFSWKNLFNSMPTKEQVGILWAQYALETGGGGSCFCYNIGNIKKIKDKGYEKYFMLPNTWEVINGKKVVFQPPHEATWFRAYDSLQDGVYDYIKFLSTGRYKTSFEAMKTGSPEQFAHLLKLAGYYTAPEEDYVHLVRRGFNVFMKSSDYENAVADLNKSDTQSKPEDIQIGPTPFAPLDFGHDVATPGDDAPLKLGLPGKLYNIFVKPILDGLKK